MEIIDHSELKYFGILRNFDFDNINRETFHILIGKDIFDVYELSDKYKSGDDYYGMELNDEKVPFSDFFLFNEEEYHLKKDVFREMVDMRNGMLNAFNDIESIINEIEGLVGAEFITEKKISILEENYRKHYNQIKNKDFYPLFKDNVKVNGYESWEDYLRIEFIEGGDLGSVVKFLRGILDYLPDSIINDWDEYFAFSKISDYCAKRRNEILGVKAAAVKSDSNGWDTSKRIMLFEKLRLLNEWQDLSTRKKAKLIHPLVNKNEDNIRDVYSKLDKKGSELSDKFKKDNSDVDDFIKSILG